MIASYYDVTAGRSAGDHSQGRGTEMAGRGGKTRVRKVPLSQVKDDLSKYLRLAGKEEIVITRHGRPAGVLIGFASEDDWFDYRLETAMIP
jgi:prevent-host-death family protein